MAFIAQTWAIAAASVSNVRMYRGWPRQSAGNLLNAPKIHWRSLWLPLLQVCSFRPHGIPRNTRNRRRLKGGSYARTQSSSRQYSIARGPGSGASSQRAGLRRHRCSTRLFLRLLWLCTLRVRAHGLLRARILLQRHLPGHGPMGRLGL
jgi:hypothetical protein